MLGHALQYSPITSHHHTSAEVYMIQTWLYIFFIQVVEYPNDTKSLKLGDFGLAVEVTEPLYTVCGTPTYVAPEILNESGYGLKVSNPAYF